jgi:thioredoxin-related protein
MGEKLKSHLEVASNVAILLVALLILGFFARNLFYRNGPNLQSGLKIGDKIEHLPPALIKGEGQTLVVFMNTKCRYCTASIPFYNQLVELQQAVPNRISIVGVFTDNEEEVKVYVQRENLKMITALTDPSLFNAVGTPTLVLLDKSASVQNFWVGQLSKEQEQQVIGLFR